MNKLKVCEYMVDLFKEPVYAVIGEASAFLNWVNRKFGLFPTINSRCTGMHWCLDGGREGGYVNIIWMPEWHGTVDDMGTLLHEVVHYVAETLSSHSIPMVTVQNDSVQAEFLAYFVRQVYTELLARIVTGDKGNDRGKAGREKLHVPKRGGNRSPVTRATRRGVTGVDAGAYAGRGNDAAALPEDVGGETLSPDGGSGRRGRENDGRLLEIAGQGERTNEEYISSSQSDDVVPGPADTRGDSNSMADGDGGDNTRLTRRTRNGKFAGWK